MADVFETQSLTEKVSQRHRNVAVNHAEDWVMLFHRLFPLGRVLQVKLLISDIVFLNPSGIPRAWYYTSQNGVLKHKPSHQLTFPRIEERFKESSARIHNTTVEQVEQLNLPIAIIRQGFSSKKLHFLAFKALLEDLERGPSGKMSQDIVFCIQAYIPPANDLRYVTTLMQLDVVNIECDTFSSGFSKRYMEVIEPEQNTEESRSILYHSRTDSPATPASDLLNSCIPTWENEVQGTQAQLTQMRRTTARIVAHVNTYNSSSEPQLQGLVCEYIIDATSSRVYLHGILGARWAGNVASWVKNNESDPDAQLIAHFIAKRTLTKPEGDKIEPKNKGSRSNLAENVSLPVISKAQNSDLSSISFSPRTKSAESTKSTKSPQKPSTPGLKAASPRSISVIPTTQQEVIQVSRTCKPPLVIELSKQVDTYRDILQESIQRAIDAEERESVQKSLVEQLHNAKQNLLNSLTTAVEGHNKEISDYSSKLEKTLARAQKAELRCDDLETQLKQTLEREAQMKSTLDKERETAFAIMSDFQERVSTLESKLRESESRIEKMSHSTQEAESKAEQDSELVSAVKRQLVEYKQQTESLKNENRKMALDIDLLTKERDNLLRALPIAQSSEKPMRFKIFIEDLVMLEENPQVELEIVGRTISEYQAKLKQIFNYYALVGENSTKNSRSITFTQLQKFIRDCGLTAERDLPIGTLDIIFQKANRGGTSTSDKGVSIGRKIKPLTHTSDSVSSPPSANTTPIPSAPSTPIAQTHRAKPRRNSQVEANTVDNVLLFREFVEVLVRLANVKYNHLSHLAERVTEFLTTDVIPNAKSTRGMG